jgi:hypothetical protein
MYPLRFYIHQSSHDVQSLAVLNAFALLHYPIHTNVVPTLRDSTLGSKAIAMPTVPRAQ